MQQPPPLQPPFGNAFGEPTQPPGQPPPPPLPPLPDTPPVQPAPQAPESAYRQPIQGQEPSAPQAPGAPSAQPPQAPAPSVPPGYAQWVTFSKLRGHPLIDITAGKNIGTVHDLIFDQQRQAIQAFSTKGSLLHKPTLVPAASAAIGADAVTFPPGTLAGQDVSWLYNLPKASDLMGRQVHSNRGQLLGTVEELRIDPASRTLMALELTAEKTGIPHRLGSPRRLVSAKSIISYGPDTIVALEEGISEL